MNTSYLLIIYLTSIVIGVYNVFQQEKGIAKFLWTISMICIPIIVSVVYILISTFMPSSQYCPIKIKDRSC